MPNTTPDLRVRILRCLSDHTTLTLATVDDDGIPHAASLFFAEEPDLSLIFTSDTAVQHSRNLNNQPLVSAAIAADGQDWDCIRGLQLFGRCRLLNEQERAAAWAVYTTKFPFISRTPLLSQRLRDSGLYRLRPAWIRLIDNTRGFGFKEELDLPSTADH